MAETFAMIKGAEVGTRIRAAVVDALGLLDMHEWLANVPAGAPVAGPILRRIADRVPPTVPTLPPQYWCPNAAAVARLAARCYAEGQRDDLWSLVPHYSRRSAAEEKWDQKKT